MSLKPHTLSQARPIRTLLAVLLLVVAGVGIADDRDLLRDSSGIPMMGLILDTSGSMHWTPPCNEIDACLDIDPWDGMCTTECPLDEAICQRVCPDFGCVEYDFSLEEPEVYEIFMDTEDGSGIEVEGQWLSSQLFSPFVGDNYLHNGNTGQGDKSVTFRPSIPASGVYQVYLFWNANEFRASNVPVRVVHADGEDTILVDQGDETLVAEHAVGVYDYNWVGTFNFEAGTAGSITIETDDTDAFVVADGLRMFGVAKPDEADIACEREWYRCQQPLCMNGDCQAPLNADDPTSKFFQAKSALYEVLAEATNVHLGFATYEQDNARLQGKHWLYEVMEEKPTGGPQDLDFPTGFFTYTFPTTIDEFPVVGSKHVFGLGAPYNDDGLGDGWNCANYKSASVPSTGTVDYPGKLDGFGMLDDPRGDAAVVSCFFTEPADLNDDWEMERARRLPKLGINGDEPTTMWYRDSESDAPGQPDGRMIKVVYNPVAGYEYGDDVLAVEIEARRCFDATCTFSSGGGFSIGTNTVYFKLISDYVAWEDKIGRSTDKGLGYFQELRNVEVNSNMDCNGLELNDDRCYFTPVDMGTPAPALSPPDVAECTIDASLDISQDDYWNLFTFKRVTVEDPRGDEITLTRTLEDGSSVTERADWFDEGDFLPLDWLETHNQEVKERLAPNIAGGTGLEEPDFRTAVFWEDEYIDGDEGGEGDPTSPTNRRLAIRDNDQLPLLPIGQTPIAASLDDFRRWFAGDEDESLNGWSGVAAERDIDWACRDKFVLFLTDGNETCGGDPCQAALDLFNAGINTYVIGFGLDNSESDLGCIAEKGGTGEPLLPRNKDELVEALEDILSNINVESKSFASASVPAIQSTAAEKIYLSSFVPLPGVSVWPGEIDAFRKPIPLDERKRPDTSPERNCKANGLDAACHLWEVGEVIMAQTPTNDELRDGVYRIGSARDERRVFYSQNNPTGKRPTDLVLFRSPYLGGDGTDTADLEDLAEVFVDEETVAQYYKDADVIAADPTLTEAEIEALITADDLMEGVERVIINTLKRKSLGTAAEGDRTHYVMGDIFHSNPAVVAGPSDLSYFANDLCGRLQGDGTPNNCVDGEDRGYRRFAREHVWRRRMLVAATNDGQLHFIDAGTRIEAQVAIDGELTGDTQEFFTDGTGEELFAYIPRLTLPIVREQALEDVHIFSLDGDLRVKDVFIDPAHDSGGADAADREWRTVLMGGMREAGNRYEETDDVEDFVSGYFALDITQPDILVQRGTDKDDNGNFYNPPRESLLPVSTGLTAGTDALPSCLDFAYDTDGHQEAVTSGGTYTCEYPFPAELWTFTDSAENGLYALDEEDNGDGTFGNGVRDLGDTWSTPVMGQIAVCAVEGGNCSYSDADNDLTSMHVAIFGGGMDDHYKTSPQRGYWLYIVDIETGEAIYKRRLDGAAPANPAVLDTNQDGLIDAIYMGTTNGTLYKVDLTGLDNNGDVPHVKAVDMRGKTSPTTDTSTGTPINVTRVIDDGAWDPFPIVETYGNAPIYFAPSAFYIPELNRFGLVFGTGDREDLWVPTTKEGRVYVVVDEGFTESDLTASTASCATRLPIVDDCIQNIGWNDPPPTVGDTDELDGSVNYLLNNDSSMRRGYTMTFPERFRLTAQPFVLTGILIFPMFEPIAFVPDGDDDDDDDSAEDVVVCARTGITRSFVILAQNANPVARLSAVDQGEDPEIDGDIVGGDTVDTGAPDATTGALKEQDRYHRIAEFTTAPFVDQTANKANPDAGGANVGDLVEDQVEQGVLEAIRSYYPRGCRFNDAYRVAITAMRVTTGLNVYATVPQAICPFDWRSQ